MRCYIHVVSHYSNVTRCHTYCRWICRELSVLCSRPTWLYRVEELYMETRAALHSPLMSTIIPWPRTGLASVSSSSAMKANQLESPLRYREAVHVHMSLYSGIIFHYLILFYWSLSLFHSFIPASPLPLLLSFLSDHVCVSLSPLSTLSPPLPLSLSLPLSPSPSLSLSDTHRLQRG